MYNKFYWGVGAAICLWFATGAIAGWKGWVPPLDSGTSGSYYHGGSGSSYGGHRSTGFGGWGGGK